MRLAFIGGHGHHYLKNLLHSEMELEVAAAGDGHDNDAALRSLPKWTAPNGPVPQWFDTPEQLFDEFKPDVVSIGAVYGHNGTIAAMALERDIAVVCDKPIAANWEQFHRLQELTQGTSRVLLTEFPFRSRPEFRAAWNAVKTGAIGEVVLATAQKSYRFGAERPAWYANRTDYPGTLFWVASHAVDVIHFCGGQALSPVQVRGNNLARPEYSPMEDHVAVLFSLENGGTAIVHADFLRPNSAPTHGDDRLRIAGTKGVVEVREGRCILIDTSGENDITDSVTVRPVEDEMLAAIRGEKSVYSTEESLVVAELLLRANDILNH